MSSAASPVAAPTADTSTATAGDPMNDDPMDYLGLSDTPMAAIPQLGDAPPAPTDSAPAATTPATQTTPTPAAGAAGEPAAASDDDVGEPYTIGKDGRVRGPDGRWMKKPDDPAPAADPKSAAPVPTPEGPAKSGPFKYRALGATKEFEGASVDAATGDVTIKADKIGILREALNAKETRDVEVTPWIQRMERENAGLRAQLAQATSTSTLTEAKAAAQMKLLDAALLQADDEKAIAAFFEMRANMPTLLKDAEVEYWKKQAAQQAKPTPQGQAPAAAAPPVESRSAALPTADEVAGAAKARLDDLRIEHAYHDLTDADWQQFDAGVARKPMAYVRLAGATDVQTYGVTLGEPVFDNDLFDADVAEYAKGLREQRAAAARQVKLAADNSRRTQPSVQAPPTVTKAAPPAKSTGSGITNKTDLEKWFDSPEL